MHLIEWSKECKRLAGLLLVNGKSINGQILTSNQKSALRVSVLDCG